MVLETWGDVFMGWWVSWRLGMRKRDDGQFSVKLSDLRLELLINRVEGKM